MNVLFSLLSADIAGGQKVCLGIIKHLKQSNHQIFVTLPGYGPLVDILEKLNVEVKFVNTRKLFYLHSILRLAWIIKIKKIQIIHTHDALSGTVLARIAGLITLTPVISHMHTIQDYTYFSRNRIKAFIAKKVDNLTSNLSQQTLVASNAVKTNLIKQGIRCNKIKVIPYGVDLGFDRELHELSGRSEENLASFGKFTGDIKTVGIIARICPSKGLKEFIRAIPIVKKEFDNVSFIVVGEDAQPGGIFKKELEKLIMDLKIEDAVKFIGFRFDIAELLKRIDILTVPSLSSEGSPLIIFEAFFCSKSVIATTVGGIPEQIKDGVNGILIRPKDEKMLAEAILSLLKDEKKRDAMGNAARVEAEKKFSQELMAKKIYSLYNEILKH